MIEPTKTYKVSFKLPEWLARRVEDKRRLGVPYARTVQDALAAHLRPHRKVGKEDGR